MSGDNPGTRIVTKIIFPVDNMDRAVAFYRQLGFGVEQYDDGYSWVKNGRDEVLHLARADDFEPRANRSAGYLHVQVGHAGVLATGPEREPPPSRAEPLRRIHPK